MPVRHTEYLDGPEAHLPHGMRHVGYDADAETHQYRDTDGSLWQSAPGNRYGRLRLVHRPAPPTGKGSDERRRSRKEGGKGTEVDDKLPRRSHRESASSLAEPAPPPYPRRRRFTSFDQLYERGESHRAPRPSEGGDDGGMLRRLGRSLSTRLRAGSTGTAGQLAPAANGSLGERMVARAKTTVKRKPVAAENLAAGSNGRPQQAEIGRTSRSAGTGVRGLARRGTI
jgi:hypothetical protein